MAVLAACASTNFTTSTTWALVDSTSYLNSETGSEILTTAYSGTRSSTFTPGAITIDGLGVKLSVQSGTTGTISVELITGGVPVVGTEVTINVSDLPAASTSSADGGWIFFKFAAPVLLITATAYSIEAKTSSASQVSLFRDGTTDNISRYLRTTTTQAPVAGDDLIIAKEWTAAGTGTARTVTMNETAATDYGSASTSLVTPSLSICQGGTLTYGTAGSTNYLLQQSGCVVVYNGGTLSMGTIGGEIPRNSSAVLQFDCAADGDFGLTIKNGGTYNSEGLSRSSGKDIYYCLLNTDEAIASTSLGVDTDTGWLDNDEIAVASTTRTTGDSENGTMNGNATASTLTVDGFAGAGGGLAVAHSGTSPTQAEVVLLTRNVRVVSVSSTAVSYVSFRATSIVHCRWTEYRYLGQLVTAQRGIEIDTTTGSCDMQYCCIRDTEDGGLFVTTSSGSITFSNNVMYNINTSGGSNTWGINIAATTGAHTINNNICIKFTAAGTTTTSINILDSGSTYSGNRFVSLGSSGNYGGIRINDTFSASGTFSNNIIHSGSGVGISISGANYFLVLNSCQIYRNTSFGILFGDPGTMAMITNMKMDTCTLFGNGTANIAVVSSLTNLCNFMIESCTIRSDSTFSTTDGLKLNLTGSFIIFIRNSHFSTTTAHSGNDINLASTSAFAQIVSINTEYLASTEFSSETGWNMGSYIRSQKHDQSSSTFLNVYRFGRIAQETTTRHTASGYAWKMTPNNASNKLIMPGPIVFDTFKAAVNASSLVTITAYILKDAAYNGNAARLVLIGGIVGGISSDVTASYSKTTKTITNATNATPIVITSNSHGYANGDVVLIEGVGGNTAANGRFVVANQTANTFELTGSTGNGAYTSGGTSNVYEQLIVTATPNEAGVVEFYVDCDGTAGNIYVDDMTVNQP